MRSEELNEQFNFGFPQLSEHLLQGVFHYLENKTICLTFFMLATQPQMYSTIQVFLTEADIEHANVKLIQPFENNTGRRLPKVVTLDVVCAADPTDATNRAVFVFDEGELRIRYSKSFFYSKHRQLQFPEELLTIGEDNDGQ